MRAAVASLIALLALPGLSAVRGDEAREKLRATLLEQMRERAEATKVQFVNGASQPKLERKPVFRYDDQQRGFIDATVWAWTLEGRPVAFQKIEVMREFRDKPLWNHCFASFAEELITADWGQGRTFRAKEPGATFQPLADSPAPAMKPTERKRQLRELARSFTARISTDPQMKTTEEMRLLATPVFETTNPKSGLVDLAVFGYSTAGTNPDMFVVLDLRGLEGKPTWHYALVRMTAGGVILKQGETTAFEVPFVLISEAPFPAWTFFQAARVPAEDEP